MSRRATVPSAVPWHPARPGLERAFRVDPLGRSGPSAGQVSGRYWRAVAHGWYRPVEQPVTVEQRIVEASYLLPPHGGVTGWAALRWHGGRWFDGRRADGSPRDVPIGVIGAHRVHREGVRLTKERFIPADLVSLDGLRTTANPVSVLFEMRHAPDLRAAVTALDMACYNDLVSIAEVQALADRCSGWTGIPRAREALTVADENCWSPAEVDLRLTWVLVAQLGPVVCNQPVFDREGRHLFTPDVFDPVCGVAGEYQGVHHFQRDQRRLDVARENLLRDHGVEYVERIAGEDLTRFLIRLRSAYARAARLPVSERRWTIQAPTGWVSTTSVAARRALSEGQRARLLRHRSIAAA